MLINKLLYISLSLPPVVCVAQESWVKLSGFGMWVQDMPREGTAVLRLTHAWVIVDRELDSNFSVRGIFALAGPPKLVHSLFGRWVKPLPGLDYVRAGRFEPPFGHVNYYRIDRNFTITYSAIDYPLVARSNGVEVGGLMGSLRWKFAAMSGERLRGNIPPADQNRWDMYLRPQYPVFDSVTIGMSVRLGPVKAWGADAQLEASPIHLETECVSSQDTVGYSMLGVYQALAWLRGLLRYERLRNEHILTPGFTVSLPYDSEFKVNAVYARHKIQIVLGQFIVRW